MRSFALEVTLVIAALIGVILWQFAELRDLQERIVGRTPEGFHRTDAGELMAALCEANPALTCPDPYQLARYLEMTGEGE